MNNITESKPDPSLSQFLHRWRVLEPERCQALGDRHVVALGGGSAYIVGHIPAQELAWIQAAVQEAITTRGWTYLLDVGTDGAYAQVDRYDEDSRRTTLDSGKADKHPAAALLTAYLKALEVS